MIEQNYEVIDVEPGNITEMGFFCYMSKPKSPGYQQKRKWLGDRFTEGLKLKILHEKGGRHVGFFEYIPGEYAWRAVHAPGYLVIHCLWVVGKGKCKGYGTRLLEECLEDARRQGRRGVVMVSSDGTWLARKDIFLRNGFVEVEQAAPSFQLLVHRLDAAPDPSFPKNWEERLAHLGSGMTIVRSSQCPYNEDAVGGILQFAQESHIPVRTVELNSAREVQDGAPCPYGTFGVVLDGRLFSYTYLKQADFIKLLQAK